MYKYSLNNSPDLSLLSTKELAVINDVIDKLSDMSSSEISTTLMEILLENS